MPQSAPPATSDRFASPVPVTFVITTLDVGGAERCLTELTLRISRERFTPTVIVLGPRPIEGNAELVDRLEAANVVVHFLDATSSWQLPSLLGRLRRLLRSLRPTIVQAFMFHANVAAAWAARKEKITVFVGGIRVADPSRWRRGLESWVFRHAQGIVGVSDESVAPYQSASSGTRIVTIPNGVDFAAIDAVPPIAPSSLSLPPTKKAITFVGRLHRQKGLDWLFSFAPQFLKQLPQHDIVLVGRGPDESALRAQCVSAGVADRVHWLGWRADVTAIMKASDLVILPSRWEGMPNVILEAMACGRPVVTTRVEGVGRLLGDSDSLQVVELGNAKSFCERVVQLASDKQLAERVGQANLRRVQEHFSLAMMIREYEELYSSLLAKKI